MVAPQWPVYALLFGVVALLVGARSSTTHTAVTALVWALLLAQSLHPADLARALPGLQTRHARQAERRVRRILSRPVVHSVSLTPRLLPAVLWLVHDAEVTLVLDSTRCRRWEIFTLGVRFSGGRVLPVAWSVLPYPWPKGRFRPTVVALVDRTLRDWPVDRPVHLVADRGFPSLPLFRRLDAWRPTRPLGYTIRLRASDWVRLHAGQTVKVGDLLAGVAVGTWQCYRAAYQKQGHAGPASWLVLGRGLPIVLPHQRGPADQARRQVKAARRQAHLRSKGQPQALTTDTVWALLTTAETTDQAVAWYRRRFSTEGTYRDWKRWDLAAVAGHETRPTHLDGLLGLAALAYLVQAALGAAAGRATDRWARARQQQWSTTDRLSVFWRGRQVLHDRGSDWLPWLTTTLTQLTADLITHGPARTTRQHCHAPTHALPTEAA